MSPERHEKSERRPPVSWRPCAGVQPRSSVHLVTYHACQRSGTTCCSASDHLKESDDTVVKARGKSDQDSVTKYHQFRSIVVYSNPACWFLESASEVKQRENDEKLKSLVHYCVLWETKHPSARSPQWKSEPSNSFSPQQCKWWSWNCAGWQGSRISREFHCFVKFQAKLMMLLYWGIFLAILIDREENKSSIFHPRSRMSWLTAEEKP